MKSETVSYPELRAFAPFEKIARYYRDISISEKIDGTNGSVLIDFVPFDKEGEVPSYGQVLAHVEGQLKDPETGYYHDGVYFVRAASRKGLLRVSADNHGFAQWVVANAKDLTILGPGQHSGEWYGKGIGRGYGLQERRFALFNPTVASPDCCEVTPQLYVGPAVMPDGQDAVKFWMRQLAYAGSAAVRGYKKPEGVVVFHTGSNRCFKATFEFDAEGKGSA
jgi:hypothetical protein